MHSAGKRTWTAETTKTPHKFYPLIILCETKRLYSDGSTESNRWIERNIGFDARHNATKLHILYGRQLGKLATHKFAKSKGKTSALMDMPYSIADTACDLWPACDCELEYLRHSPKGNLAKVAIQVDGMAIIDAELGHE